MISCRYAVLWNPSRGPLRGFRRLRPRRSKLPGQAAPWPAEACADRSRPFDSPQGQGRVATPMRSCRSSGWSEATWHETTGAVASGCLEKSSQPSRRSFDGNSGSATGRFSPSRPMNDRIVNIENHPAIADGSDKHGMIPRFETNARIRAGFLDSSFPPVHFIIEGPSSAYPSSGNSSHEYPRTRTGASSPAQTGRLFTSSRNSLRVRASFLNTPSMHEVVVGE